MEDLQCPPVCSAAVEGGGRMYPISINLRAESDPRAYVRAHACLSLNETLCDGGVVGPVSGAASDDSVDLPPASL